MEAHWHNNRLNLDQQLLRVDEEVSDNVHGFSFRSLQLNRNVMRRLL